MSRDSYLILLFDPLSVLLFPCNFWGDSLTLLVLPLTKLFLTKLILKSLFIKITNFTHNSSEMFLFPGDLEGTKSLQNSKNDSQGINFVIISCQRIP